MKTIISVLAFLFISLSLQAQVDRTNFRAGLNAGIITGEVSDFYSFSLGVDFQYVWGLSKEIDLGFATGFNNAFGEEESFTNGGITVTTEFANLQYIPAAAALRIYPSYGFKLGGDVGYAIGVSDGFDGGLYYRPMIGVDINGTTELNVSYTAISNDGTFATAMIGVLFLF
ncbi:hypothetical protein MTsPCn9_12170 [Croceitalea sp. MTPC9]|uniref:outer membrane beta-barrel protein n=1 Tax=unclassified Croceitalea TaxID=2632280 RepID=UPI002B3E0910|nr:hypothetical protein MTsPCn6_31470 [Croceitalea sp. MTPC6]GMN16281.1 hypothetical protein MTsPCn9_12170 [Croceitalea sp. MTPC9]